MVEVVSFFFIYPMIPSNILNSFPDIDTGYGFFFFLNRVSDTPVKLRVFS